MAFGDRLREEGQVVLRLVEAIARENLEALDIDASGNLKNTLEAFFDDDLNIVLEFDAYGVIQDKGLSGRRRMRSSPFQAGFGLIRDNQGARVNRANIETAVNNGAGQIPVFTADIFRWIQDRGIAVSSPNGPYAIRDSIVNQGYEARPWIDKTVEDPRIAEAFARVIDRCFQEDIDRL